MSLNQEINHPRRALSSRPLLNRLNKKRQRLIIRLHSPSHSNRRTIRRKPDANHTPTIRNTIRANHKRIPGRTINSLRPNTPLIPPAKPFANEHFLRHRSELISHSRCIKSHPKRRVRIRPLSTKTRLHPTRGRPLNPRQTAVLTLNTSCPRPRENITIHTGSWWRPYKDLQRVPRRRRRYSGQQRCLSIIVILLRLVTHQNVNSETTARSLRPSNELNRATIRQLDSFLTVSPSDVLDNLSKLRILPFILKKRRNPQNRFPCRFNLMRGKRFCGLRRFLRMNGSILSLLRLSKNDA